MLAQIGLLDTIGIPVVSGDQARALVDPTVALNELITETT